MNVRLEMVLSEVRMERHRQDKKWGDQRGNSLPTWLAILVEEVGEVAEAMLEQSNTDADQERICEELVQVAAVAVATVEHLRLKRWETRTLKYVNRHGESVEIPFNRLAGADLREASLTGANLRAADLRNTDLTEADLRRAVLTKANLIEADLRGVNLRGADLTKANLRGAVLRGADLTDADLTGADLSGADLRGADLAGADLRGAILTGALIDNESWEKSCEQQHM